MQNTAEQTEQWNRAFRSLSEELYVRLAPSHDIKSWLSEDNFQKAGYSAL